MVGLPPLAARDDFPILSRPLEGTKVVYLDSAATSLKPTAVIAEVRRFYEEISANIHRGKHWLSQDASEAYEAARSSVAQFINALPSEVVFTSNATEGVNLVAHGLALEREDNVVVSILEHHSNLLPWMSRCQLRYLPEGADGRLDVSRLESLIDARTRAVALTHVSNVTGAVTAVEQAVEIARRREVPVLIDAAQSIPHRSVDVVALGCDFLVFSGHKMLGPSGVGILYARRSSQGRLRPLKLGGGVVDRVTHGGFALKGAPYCFEAGTPNIEGVLGLRAAVEYLSALGMDRVREHDRQLAALLLERCRDLPGVTILGPAEPTGRAAIVSLVPPPGAPDTDTLAMMLSDGFKVMCRSGQHCAHPYFEMKQIAGALRLSGYVYTGAEDVERAAAALHTLLG